MAWSIILLKLVVYLSVLAFTSLIVIKVRRYSKMPVHLRWELYPVAHQTSQTYGSSYFEEPDWWLKTRKKNFWGELRYVVWELISFRLYYRHQKKYWFVVYPFHIGIFLLICWFAFLLIGSLLLMFSNTEISANAPGILGNMIYYLTLGTGVAGFSISIIGCIGLLVERSVDKDLNLYATPMDYFNHAFILAILLSGLFGWLIFDPGFATSRAFMKSLFVLSSVIDVNPATYINILLTCLFLVYMPFTPIMHYIAKYFIYHKVLWDDESILQTPGIEKEIGVLLNRSPSWSASHIGQGRTWGDITSKLNDDIEEKVN